MILPAVAAAGLLAGTIHVLAGADHLAAVAPLAASDRRHGWRVGLRWGLGHAAGVTIVALLAFGLREALPLPSLTQWSERLVGVTLIGIGVWALTGAVAAFRRAALPSDAAHAHVHGPEDEPVAGMSHAHWHVHGGIAHAHVHRHGRPRVALWLGLLHGTAGAGHVLGVIPALALPTRAAALVYLAGFGAATIVAMTAFATLAGLAGLSLAQAGPRAWAGLLAACGLASVVVGAGWLALG